MDALALLGKGLITLLIFLLNIYCWIIVASALISWVLLPPTNPIVRFLRFVTEPVLNPCRHLLYRILPFSWRRFNFSPVLAIILVQLVILLLRIFSG
jgi:uncharacterized protein YggT (Ycf19 family)